MPPYDIIGVQKVPEKPVDRVKKLKEEQEKARQKAAADAKAVKNAEKERIRLERERMRDDTERKQNLVNIQHAKVRKDGMINALESNISVEWKTRKLTDQEIVDLLKTQNTKRFVDLFIAVLIYAGLIMAADFFTFRMQGTFEYAWLTFIPFTVVGFYNILHVIHKHDRILWALKANCDVSDVMVLYRSFWLLGRHGKKNSLSAVYCISEDGNNRMYYPFATYISSLFGFKYKSSAVVLWVAGTKKPEEAVAVKFTI